MLNPLTLTLIVLAYMGLLFAIAWYGEEADPEINTRVCGSDRVIENKPPPTREEQLIVSSASGRFYVIVGSLSTLNDANDELNKYIQEGFKKAKVITKDNKFRISLADYSTKELANTGKKELPSKYQEAWIMGY